MNNRDSEKGLSFNIRGVYYRNIIDLQETIGNCRKMQKWNWGEILKNENEIIKSANLMIKIMCSLYLSLSISFTYRRDFVDSLGWFYIFGAINARWFINKCATMGNGIVWRNATGSHIKSILKRCGHCRQHLASMYQRMASHILLGKLSPYFICSILLFCFAP